MAVLNPPQNITPAIPPAMKIAPQANRCAGRQNHRQIFVNICNHSLDAVVCASNKPAQTKMMQSYFSLGRVVK